MMLAQQIYTALAGGAVQPTATLIYSFMGAALVLKLLAVVFGLLSRCNTKVAALSGIVIIIASIDLISNLTQIGLSLANGGIM